MPDPWYPPPSAYYVPAEEAYEYPLRQGDVVGPMLIGGRHTPIAQVVHPTCEPGKGMFANFRWLHLADREEVSLANRRAALTHDCRVYFIRRWFYFRFRILLSLDQLRGLEAERIRADQAFQGPRPPWAV